MSKRALVIDSETTVIDVVVQFLEYDGYEVWRAATREMGAEFAENDEEGFRLVVMDIDPDRGGLDADNAVARIRCALPRANVIGMSGYVDNPPQTVACFDSFLEKPFAFRSFQLAVNCLAAA